MRSGMETPVAGATSPGGKAYFISQGEPVNCWRWIDEVLALAELPPVEKSVSRETASCAGTVCEFVYRLAAARWRAADVAVPGGAAEHLALVRYFGGAKRVGISAARLDRRGHAAVGRLATPNALSGKLRDAQTAATGASALAGIGHSHYNRRITETSRKIARAANSYLRRIAPRTHRQGSHALRLGRQLPRPRRRAVCRSCAIATA